MKRLAVFILIFTMMLSICGCSKTEVHTGANVTLTFKHNEKDISVALTDDEAEKVVDILGGNSYHSNFSGVPSCGFDESISLKIGERVYAVARDTCNIIQELDKSKYFDISEEDMKYIHTLFEKHGGYFPCV